MLVRDCLFKLTVPALENRSGHIRYARDCGTNEFIHGVFYSCWRLGKCFANALISHGSNS